MLNTQNGLNRKIERLILCYIWCIINTYNITDFWRILMYNMICTQNDVLRERFIAGAELAGKYGFPQLEPINADVEGLKPIPFHMASKEKSPRKAVCHCFIDDSRFESLYKNPLKSLETLQNFKYIMPPDFSFYSDIPLALQIYQAYRARSIHYFLSGFGIKCIPVVGWSDIRSYEFCFDGLPINSTLAVSTNGCFSKDGKECYRQGFSEMCKRLNPNRVIVIGREIEVSEDINIQYLESFGQTLTKKLRG